MTDTTSQALEDFYRVGPEIGRGSFANVYKGQHIKSRIPVAIKSVQLSRLNKKLLENLDHEITILKKIKHAHIVSLIDTYKTPTYFYLVMEYCSLGDLSFFFRKRKEICNSLPLINSMFERYPPTPDNGLHEDVACHFIKQLASALEFLRKNQLIHRDIKPQNLLLCPPEKSEVRAKKLGVKGLWELPVLKLADFGFARILPSTSMAETLCGSPLYMAPEILRLEKYTAKADLWSVGAVMYEMVAGHPPFKASNHVELLSIIEKNNDAIQFPEASKISKDIKRLVRSLLKKDPSERVSFAEFFSDPVITGTIYPPSKPLDQSLLDENLYISEYIQLGPTNPRDLANRHTPHRNSTQPHKSNHNTVGSPSDEKKTEAPASSKPTVIKSKPIVSEPSSPGSPLESSSTSHNQHSESLDNFSWVTSSNAHGNHHAYPPPNPTSPGTGLSKPNQKVASKTSQTPHTTTKTHNSTSPDPFTRSFESESEYVVVEKRTVEVNSFADEIAQPSSKNASARSSRLNSVTSESSQQQKEYYQNQYFHYTQQHHQQQQQQQQQHHYHRRDSTTRLSTGSNTSNPAYSNRIGGSNKHRNSSTSSDGSQSSGTPGTSPAEAFTRPRPERRNSIIYGSSPGNTLSRALQMAKAKISGKPINDNVEGYLAYTSGNSNSSTVTPAYSTSTYPFQHQRRLSFTSKISPASLDAGERRLLKHLENLQSKAKVLILFAEVKYRQMAPSSNDNHFGESRRENDNNNNDGDDFELENEAMVVVATEAFALYYKSLTLLDKFIKIASQWWKSRCKMTNPSNSSGAFTSATSVDSSPGGGYLSNASSNAASDQLVELVLWARDRFNECLSKADYAQSQINKYKKFFANASDPFNTKGLAERLIFDRALEMSKSAARLEKFEYTSTGAYTLPTAESGSAKSAKLPLSTSNEALSMLSRHILDLEDCISSYSTAIWMFESLLETTEEEGEGEEKGSSVKVSSGCKNDNISIALDALDRERVIKAIESVSQRLGLVKKKLEVVVNQQTQCQSRQASPEAASSNSCLNSNELHLPTKNGSVGTSGGSGGPSSLSPLSTGLAAQIAVSPKSGSLSPSNTVSTSLGNH